MRLPILAPGALGAMCLLALGSVGLGGCTRGCRTADTASRPTTPKSDSATQAEPFQKDALVFSFDYNAVTELLLVKADPDTGDRWAARVFRPSAQAGPETWRIERAGGNAAPVLESRADGYFILHLLDTLRTLRAERPDVPGTPESLGLATPRFALKWTVGDKQLEIRFGAPERSTEKSVSAKAGVVRSYAQVPGHAPFVADGASLQMLSYIGGFDGLRLKTWAGLTTDDVDEIELTGAGGAFYAQREGADWTDRKHKPLRADVSQWLEQLTHERVLAFVDDPARNEKISSRLGKSALLKATLTDRHGKPVHLAIGQIDGHWYATSSARPGAALEVHSGSREALLPPRRVL